MNHRIINRNKLGILLTTILTLSILFSSILLVNADPGGTGKFLTINFNGDPDVIYSDCNVTATKVSSDQQFIYYAKDNGTLLDTQRMSAGTVLLTATPADGWTFIKFEGDILENPDNPYFTAYYKNEKYGNVSAIFTKDGFTITSSSSEGGSISPFGSRTYAPNEQPTYDFTANTGYHLSGVIIDGSNYANLVNTGFTTQYTFPPLTSDHTIHAIFSIDGQANIEGGEDVIVFLSSGVSLNFPEVSAGIAYGNEITPVIEGDLIVWRILVSDAEFAEAELAFQFPIGSIPNEIWVCHDPNFELFLRCDLNEDGKVNGQDVNIISNIVKHPKFLEDLSQEDFDRYNLYPDDVIDENDIHVVNSFNGMGYLDFQWDLLNNIYLDEFYPVIYGTTGGFSIFRCR